MPKRKEKEATLNEKGGFQMDGIGHMLVFAEEVRPPGVILQLLSVSFQIRILLHHYILLKYGCSIGSKGKCLDVVFPFRKKNKVRVGFQCSGCERFLEVT